MIGNNTFMLNEASVIEAVQEYLDRRTTDVVNIEVTSVKGTTDGFKVCVSERADAAEMVVQ